MRLAFLAGLALAAGCATPGDEAWAGWQTVSSEVGGYRFRYLSPPFERVHDVPEGEAHIKVESTHDDDIRGLGLPELPPSHDLFTKPLAPGQPSAYARTKLDELRARGDELFDPGGEIESDFDLSGHEIYTVDEWLRYYRYVYFRLPDGRVVELQIEANDDPHMRDMNDLVASFEALP